jgi:hypothetical protein
MIQHFIQGCTCAGKECEACHHLLCHSMFARKQTGRYGLREKCKPCHAASRQEKRLAKGLPERATREHTSITPERLAELRAMPYARYLKTPEWYRKRAVFLRISGNKCQVCNGSEHLNVHHSQYCNLGDERHNRDVIVLCHPCHELFHKNRRLQQAKHTAG